MAPEDGSVRREKNHISDFHMEAPQLIYVNIRIVLVYKEENTDISMSNNLTNSLFLYNKSLMIPNCDDFNQFVETAIISHDDNDNVYNGLIKHH